MLQQGFNSLYPQDRLAVMGLLEPLKRLPELLKIRKHLYQYFVEQQFDVVIGIDSPDFNLTLEKKLRQTGIKTVHYVSPSVWAWRQGRIKLIKESVDLMLTLLPFEAQFYKEHDVPVKFVGHPLADQFELDNNIQVAKEHLVQLFPMLAKILPTNSTKKMIACLPGSRQGEVKLIGPVIWQSIQQLYELDSNIEVIVPALNSQRRQQIEMQLSAPSLSHLPIHIVDGHSQAVMAASDFVIMASGTTTLEAMLLKKPMVVVYKKDFLSYAIISRLLKTKFISLPNLLAGKQLVPELLQKKATPEAICTSLQFWMSKPDEVKQLKEDFLTLHQQLQQNASEHAAAAIIRLTN